RVEPIFIVAPVQANVSHSRSYMFRGSQRASQQRLIDVAESDVVAHEFSNRLWLIPALMPHLDHARILDELPQQLLDILRFRLVFLKETGNWMSRAPSFPSAASESSPSRARRSSLSFGRILAADVGSITASGECVNDRCNLAVKRKFGLTEAAFRDHRRPSSGRMCP